MQIAELMAGGRAMNLHSSDCRRTYKFVPQSWICMSANFQLGASICLHAAKSATLCALVFEQNYMIIRRAAPLLVDCIRRNNYCSGVCVCSAAISMPRAYRGAFRFALPVTHENQTSKQALWCLIKPAVVAKWSWTGANAAAEKWLASFYVSFITIGDQIFAWQRAQCWCYGNR